MATSDINAIKEETGVYVVVPNNNGSNNYNIAQIIEKNLEKNIGYKCIANANIEVYQSSNLNRAGGNLLFTMTQGTVFILNNV